MKIIFVLKNGAEKVCDFSEGQTILQVAEENKVPIMSFCEGFGVCGACHVVVENAEEMADRLPAISEEENATLDRSNGVTMHSRLACKVRLGEGTDGLKVRLVG